MSALEGSELQRRMEAQNATPRVAPLRVARDLSQLIAMYKDMRAQVRELSSQREQIMKTLAGVREEIGERLSTEGLCLLGGMVLLPKDECTPEQLEQAMKREVQP